MTSIIRLNTQPSRGIYILTDDSTHTTVEEERTALRLNQVGSTHVTRSHRHPTEGALNRLVRSGASLASASLPSQAVLASWAPSSGLTPGSAPCSLAVWLEAADSTSQGGTATPRAWLPPPLACSPTQPCFREPSLPSALGAPRALDQPARPHVPPRSALGTNAEWRPLPLQLLRRFSFLLPHTLRI